MVVVFMHVGTTGWDRERWNICKHTSQLVCACLRGLTRLNVFITSTMEKESPQSLIDGRGGRNALASKQAKKVFSLSGSNTSVSATRLVFLL